MEKVCQNTIDIQVNVFFVPNLVLILDNKFTFDEFLHYNVLDTSLKIYTILLYSIEVVPIMLVFKNQIGILVLNFKTK